MADIKVNDLKPTGAELFFDTESFMNDLEYNEVTAVAGGGTYGCGIQTGPIIVTTGPIIVTTGPIIVTTGPIIVTTGK
ncbi:hypothetical protein [Moorena sp. SIO3H5]|uniref:hypothetical protein n=1 Tax=Moorena sp. SIO3H5 TaxID=2607834 RepID=UPI0025F18587|nr:hypothetical protein [Moorena sp. SIO3H5]